MFDFKDRLIVVTGAAGNLGSAVAKKFLENGATVIALDHGIGRVKTLLDHSGFPGKLIVFDEVDVTDRDVMRRVGEKTRDEIDLVDTLVNTVGGFAMGEAVHTISPELWQRMMNLNVQSFLVSAEVFIPQMLKKGGGKVISVGSKASLGGGAKAGAYAAAKAALLRLTESMAAELKPHNIQANCILPGTIDTPENRRAMPDANFSKWVAPEQVAEAILFLASAASNGITGSALPVYGGS